MGVTARPGDNLHNKMVKIMYSSVGVTRVQQGLVSSNPNVMGNYLHNKMVKISHSSVGVTRVQQGLVSKGNYLHNKKVKINHSSMGVTRVLQGLQNKVSMANIVSWAGGRSQEASSRCSAGRIVSSFLELGVDGLPGQQQLTFSSSKASKQTLEVYTAVYCSIANP